MSIFSRNPLTPQPDGYLLRRLLDLDPSIRQKLDDDPARRPDDRLAEERARAALNGWGAMLLDPITAARFRG